MPKMSTNEQELLWERAGASRTYRISDVAALTGLTPDALRAWERVGLLTPRRSPGGMRRYTEDDLARIRLIARTLQRGGFSRRAVAALLQSGDLRPDAADYAPGPARMRRSRGHAGTSSHAPYMIDSDTGDTGDTGDSGEMRSERRTLDAVARINDALASGRPLAEVLEVICEETCRAFSVSDTILWLAEPHAVLAGSAGAAGGTAGAGQEDVYSVTRSNPVARTLVAAAACGAHATAVMQSQASRLVSLTDLHIPEVQAFLTRRGLITNMRDPSVPIRSEERHQLRGAAILVVPLLAAHHELVGVLALREALDPDRFDTDDLERVRLFAVQAALAIETARLHAEIQLARAEAESQRVRWQAAVDDLPALVCTCDEALRITYVSPTCEQMLGRPRDPDGSPVLSVSLETRTMRNLGEPAGPSQNGAEAAAINSGFFWLDDDTSGPASLPFAELPLVRALRERRAVHNIVVAHHCLDGQQRLVAWDAAPMSTAAGVLLGAVSFGRDVTAERRQAEREACLAAVTRAAAGPPDPAGAQGRAARIVRALVEHTRTPVIAATLYLRDTGADADAMRRVVTFGGEQSGTHGPALPLTRDHPWWHALMAGPSYSAHDRARPRWLRTLDPAVWKASSIRAWATVPLRSGDTLMGALSIGLSVPHVWDTAERAWLEACAAAVAMGVENDRLFAVERRRSHELEVALSAATCASVAPDPGA